MRQREEQKDRWKEKLINKDRLLRTFKSDDFCFFLVTQCDLMCYENIRIAKSERQFKGRTVNV